ncbi:MAG: 2-C-methyl-D-erythritol 2,4-cyclodiphosphate synthase [Spirochaetes bacterium]|jgi:2-C-methyl-D-erythritol 2,4-cyclodiphosphate synthase|nr:2-C-methyl-D-erythritol 2,4-cyclodiphosphate synthase [Spirochaetota bacterium]
MIHSLRTGIGFDAHRFCEGRDLVLGGVLIPFKFGLYGHSDADVLIHAIMDAVLGAAGSGDIGTLFPDTDSSYHNIRSTELLKKVKDHLDFIGFGIINIDSIVICEKPKIMPYVDSMRAILSDILSLPPDAVGIKATTTEKMGFTGREEGVASQAVALLYKK